MRNTRVFTFLLLFALYGHAQPEITLATSQYDNDRTGANLHETTLNPRNVNVRQFGKLFSFAVDGDVYAQPLYVPNLAIPGQGTHNTLFVATEHDTVYAFDATGKPATPLWKRQFIDESRHITTVPMEALGCPFINPEIGITSTPVIDPGSRTMYVLVRTRESPDGGSAQYWQRLHALDLASGREKPGGPVVIKAAVQTAASGMFGLFRSTVEFLSLHENPRAALVLSQGKIYLTWASSCDVEPYHGWVMAYDARTLRQAGVLNTSPTSSMSGIWQSDTGPPADEEGNIYVSTGNGLFDANTGGRNYGDSLTKLGFDSGALRVKDYFTPSNQEELSRTDADLGSGGPVLIPRDAVGGKPLAVVGGKGGVIYLLNRSRMGKYRSGDDRHAVQTIALHRSIKSAPAFWNGRLYYAAGDDALRQFTLRNGRLEESCRSKEGIREPGATPTISANGHSDGIVWLIETRTWNGADRAGTLHAYDASDVSREIYSSNWNRRRDQAAIARRFNIPSVADGRVYVAGSRQIDVYGLLKETAALSAKPITTVKYRD